MYTSIRIDILMDSQARRKILIDFIANNQGCTKADIEKANDVIPISRKTLFKIIGELKEDGIIEEIMEKPNSREHKLFVKKDNPLVLVTSELEEFEKAYVQLLNKFKEKSKKIDFPEIASRLGIKGIDPSKWSESELSRYFQHENKEVTELENKERELDLRVKEIESKARLPGHGAATLNSAAELNGSIRNELNSVKNEIAFLEEQVQNHKFIPSTRVPILIFKILIYAYSCRSTVIWPQIIKDKETLKKLYSIVYIKIAAIQFHLTEFLRSFDKLFRGRESSITKFVVNEYFSMQDIEDFISLKWLRLREIIYVYKEIQAVLNSITKITSEIAQYGDYNFRLLERLNEHPHSNIIKPHKIR